MEQNLWIVITTINYPTEAVKQFAGLAKQKNWSLLVVGDTKTPADWHCDGAIYLSIDRQVELYPVFARAVPVKHYCRKNIGYLYAMQKGANLIIDTDDDNLPYENFGDNIVQQISATVLGGAKWLNVYSYYTDQLIWPRGLPLNQIYSKGEKLHQQSVNGSVQQFLADKDPDVDAVYRLINKNDTYFDKNGASYIISKDCFVPFNSQNTVFFKEAFILLYLPCFVSFRMTDIWRSFIAKRILEHMDAYLVFHKPTVWQDRNQHDLMRDFNDEVVGYQRNDEIIDAITRVDLTGLTVQEAILKVWNACFEIGVVNGEEISLIRQWLSYFD
jgi:STELLO glycosyltransferases